MDYMDQATVEKVIKSGVVLAVALSLFFGSRGTIKIVAQWIKLPVLALTPVRLVIRYSILFFALVVLLELWGFGLDAVLSIIGTVLGVLAVAFMAFWSLLSNLLCAFVLVIFKPFSVGDQVEVSGADGVKGTVVDLSLLFVTLETEPGETALVPNNFFFQRTIKRKQGSATVSLEDHFHRDPPLSDKRTP